MENSSDSRRAGSPRLPRYHAAMASVSRTIRLRQIVKTVWSSPSLAVSARPSSIEVFSLNRLRVSRILPRLVSETGMLDQAQRILKDVFGYDAFRGNQGAIIQRVAGGDDALVLMPTGGG